MTSSRPHPSLRAIVPAPIITIPNVPATTVVHAPAGRGTMIVPRSGKQTRGYVRRWT